MKHFRWISFWISHFRRISLCCISAYYTKIFRKLSKATQPARFLLPISVIKRKNGVSRKGRKKSGITRGSTGRLQRKTRRKFFRSSILGQQLSIQGCSILSRRRRHRSSIRCIGCVLRLAVTFCGADETRLCPGLCPIRLCPIRFCF